MTKNADGRESMPSEGKFKRLFVGKDITWKEIEGKGFRVDDILPLAQLENGKITDNVKPHPYAYLSVYCPALKKEGVDIVMPVFNRIDFSHLWELYKERGVTSDEEVNVSYSQQKEG